jgi:hypothetical protein
MISKQDQTRRKWIEVDGKTKWQGAELDLQRQCEEYLRYFPNIAVVRFPDMAYRAIFASILPEYIKRMIAGYIKGIPDLILLRNKTDGSTAALCVELKSGKGKLSQGQKNFGNKVTVNIVRDFESFTKLISEFVEF